MLFPDEPDWDSVPDDVLIRLVEEFQDEPSCATSAILQLASTNPDRCTQLAQWLIAQPAADRWLKAAAVDALENMR